MKPDTPDTLLDFGATYPERDPFFANDFIRDIEREGLAIELGADACWLLTVIVLTEDKARYRRAPWFRMPILIERTGKQKDALRAMVQRCVAAGWLHWEQPHRHAPIYAWVTYPHWFEHKKSSAEKPPKIRRKADEDPSKSRRKAAEVPLPTIPSPNPKEPSPVPNDETAGWEAVKKGMIEIGIGEISEPLRSLKANRVDPGLALDVLRNASEANAWKPGSIRRRLINLLPGQDPRELRFWMKPDFKPVQSPDASRKQADDAQERARRLRQLELDFGSDLKDLTTAVIIERYALPAHVQERLRSYPTWRSTDRSPEVRRVVLEFLDEVRSKRNGG